MILQRGGSLLRIRKGSVFKSFCPSQTQFNFLWVYLAVIVGLSPQLYDTLTIGRICYHCAARCHSQRTLTVGGSITVQLVSSFTRLL